jgi:hypothetical protein
VIVQAAIRKNGIIYTGIRHALIIEDMSNSGISWPVTKDSEQGFVDDKGNFLNRFEAGAHAISCGQIDEMKWPGMGLDSVEIFPRRG